MSVMKNVKRIILYHFIYKISHTQANKINKRNKLGDNFKNKYYTK